MATPPLESVGVDARVDCIFRVVVRRPVQLVDRVDGAQVIATDASGEIFQVEMQTWNHGAMKERIFYTWAALYECGRIREWTGIW